MNKKKYQVFISSTYEDLKEERDEIRDKIYKMDHFPVGMESFSSSHLEQWKLIEHTLESTDFYLLIIGYRYGTLTQEGISYTQKEFEFAKKLNIPILVFIKEDGLPVVESARESKQKNTKKLNEFKELAKKERNVEWWRDKEDLANKVVIALYKEFDETIMPGWARVYNSENFEGMLSRAEKKYEIGISYYKECKYVIALDCLKDVINSLCEFLKSEIVKKSFEIVIEIYSKYGEDLEAIKWLKKKMRYLQYIYLYDDKRDMSNDYLLMAQKYSNLKDYSNSIECLSKAQSALHSDELTKEQAYIYCMYGYVYSELGYNSQSLEYYNKILDLAKELENKDTIFASFVYNSMGRAFINVSEYEKALLYCEKALDLRLRNIDNVTLKGIANVYDNLAAIYSYKKVLDKTDEMLQKALEIRMKMQLPERNFFLARGFLNKGRIYYFNERYEEAQISLEKCIHIYRQIYGRLSLAIVEVYDLMYKILEHKKDYIMAIEYLLLLYKIKDKYQVVELKECEKIKINIKQMYNKCNMENEQFESWITNRMELLEL